MKASRPVICVIFLCTSFTGLQSCFFKCIPRRFFYNTFALSFLTEAVILILVSWLSLGVATDLRNLAHLVQLAALFLHVDFFSDREETLTY